MQRYCTELTERLLKSLDKEYNVVDMGAVVDVITALEKTTITKEVLEVTRLGKYINELRRKTNNDALAKRAKDLVRRWRDMVLPSAHPTPQPTLADTAPQALNGTKPQSPALRGLKPHSPAAMRAIMPHSPALKSSFKPHSPLLRDSTPLKVLSPALSLHSDQSRSPNAASTKQYHHHQQQGSLSQVAATPNTTNHRLNAEVTPKVGLTSTHNHSFDAVPRTHSSNKRLRKDDSSGTNSPITPPLPSSVASLNRGQLGLSNSNDIHGSRYELTAKRARLNGEVSNYQSFPYAADTSNNNVVVSSRGTANSGGVYAAPTPNQKVPSPRDTDKTNNDRLSDAISCNTTDESRDAIVVETATTPESAAGPKKRGRKKGSRSVKNQSLPEDRVKEKLASISRNPKLKTTQELLADLQARGSSTGVSFVTGGTTTTSPSAEVNSGNASITSVTTSSSTTTTTTTNASSRNAEAPSNEDVLRSGEDRGPSSRLPRAKREKATSPSAERKKNRDRASERWEGSKKSDNDDDDEDDDDDDSEREEEQQLDVGRTRELTVEEILAKLPPLDRDAISWSDCEDEATRGKDDYYEDEYGETRKRREITDEDVERLHTQCIEGLNGNFQSRIDTARKEEVAANLSKEESHILEELKRRSICRRSGEKENDREFREWHEMLAKPSYEGQILHILPYVIID